MFMAEPHSPPPGSGQATCRRSVDGDMGNGVEDEEEGLSMNIDNESIEGDMDFEYEGEAGMTLTPDHLSEEGFKSMLFYEDGEDQEAFNYYDDEEVEDTQYDSLEDEDNIDIGEQTKEDVGELGVIMIDRKEDYLMLDLRRLKPDDLMQCIFLNVEVAYDFYHWYARFHGFSARRSSIRRNSKGEHVQQTFLCHRAGFREDKGLSDEMRMRRPRPDYRCGCQGKFRVHVDIISQRWYVSRFDDAHNHELVPKHEGGMLAAHKKMSDSDIMSMNGFMKSGMRLPEIFNCFASQSGGYSNVRFGKKNMSNHLAKQRRSHASDGQNAIEYLRWLGLKDQLMFERHTEDSVHGVEHLFWCDGISRMNYKVFGDVVAFDSTYRKNKLGRPVVIFSGVDHHNRTVIFASAIIANEEEVSYVWLLEQFGEAMYGKLPGAVITDGDLAMRNAIRKVFPNAHHRLCAWHLLKIAGKRIAIPEFLKRFRTCMMSDYGIGEFKRQWFTTVAEFGLEDHPWVKEMYDKREMWAATYFRGKFFAGFRTTSRCEGFHSQLLKFVHSRYDMTLFLQHFHRCLGYMRYKQFEADHKSGFGNPVLQTNFRGLERSASVILTKEIFQIFVPVLKLASEMIVTELKRAIGDLRYKVVRYTMVSKAWNVYCDTKVEEFRCCCEKMETYGLPCEHILGVLVYLHITALPKCLVSTRWTKGAKDCYRGLVSDGSIFWDSDVIARYVWLLESCRERCSLASQDVEDFNRVKVKLGHEKRLLKCKDVRQAEDEIRRSGHGLNSSNMPVRRPRGRPRTSASGVTTKRTIKCTACKVAGHNRLSCPLVRDIEYGSQSFHVDDEIFTYDEEDPIIPTVASEDAEN